MDPGLLRYYNQELQHLREMGAEFAQEFPKIAARLGMDGIEVADPYVERLLEGAAFLSARVQLKIEAEFPRFTQRFLEIVYPNYLSPTPAMLIAQLQPDLNETNLADGVTVSRGTSMRSISGESDVTACEFRTAQDVELWPIELTTAEYFTFAPDLPLAPLPYARRIKGGLRLRLRTTAGLLFNQIRLDRLRLFLSGSDEIAFKLHELCFGACVGILAAQSGRPWPWYETLPASNIGAVGYDDGEALLPMTLRSFQGYRVLQEYLAFPHRFLFVDIKGLASAVRRNKSAEMELVLLFGRSEQGLEGVVDKSAFSLFCTPAINLFPKRADRVPVSDSSYDYHIVADRTRPMDFEIHSVTAVTGYGVGNESEQAFFPLYAAFHSELGDKVPYYTIRREPRLLSEGQKRKRTGYRSINYIGTETFISLVDSKEAPFSNDLRQLAVTANCTNRDLPLRMQIGMGKTDLMLDVAAPVVAIRCRKGPSRPFAPLAEGALAWRFVSHLSLGYLSLLENNERDGAAALREMLTLYATSADGSIKRQIDGIRTIRSRRTVRRLPMPGPIAFGRGVEIELEVDELAFQGASAFLFGCVMEQFFQRYVSINSFVETVVRSHSRGEIMHGVPRCGERPIL